MQSSTKIFLLAAVAAAIAVIFTFASPSDSNNEIIVIPSSTPYPTESTDVDSTMYPEETTESYDATEEPEASTTEVPDDGIDYEGTSNPDSAITYEVQTNDLFETVRNYISRDSRFSAGPQNESNWTITNYSDHASDNEAFNNLYCYSASVKFQTTFVTNGITHRQNGYGDAVVYVTYDGETATFHYASVDNVLLLDDGFITREMKDLLYTY